MPIAPRGSVRLHVTIGILVTVVLSWVISGGVANYFSYLSFRSLRQEMLKHPETYTRPIPEPKFGIVEFFTGRPPIAHGPREPRPGPPPGLQPERPRLGPGRPAVPGPRPLETESLLLRLGVALGLAALAGMWIGRKFTRPLSQLAKGADAYQSGDFGYRIPARGANEFASVANAMNEMARQVSEQIARLEDEAQRRRQFLADAAHELRSPVTTMETMAAALRDGLADEPERRDFAISALVGTSARLRRLVQDLMELARVDLTELPLNLTKVGLHELVSSAVQAHEAEASAAGIVLHPPAGGAVETVADPDRIAQVLDNIIGNAVSHAGRGAEVSVSLENADPVRITVSDTGKGIPARDLPYVLDPFFRSDPARTPEDCHSGLGLSIARRLVEAHGGKLTIRSEEGKGTTVTILIPRKIF